MSDGDRAVTQRRGAKNKTENKIIASTSGLQRRVSSLEATKKRLQRELQAAKTEIKSLRKEKHANTYNPSLSGETLGIVHELKASKVAEISADAVTTITTPGSSTPTDPHDLAQTAGNNASVAFPHHHDTAGYDFMTLPAHNRDHATGTTHTSTVAPRLVRTDEIAADGCDGVYRDILTTSPTLVTERMIIGHQQPVTPQRAQPPFFFSEEISHHPDNGDGVGEDPAGPGRDHHQPQQPNNRERDVVDEQDAASLLQENEIFPLVFSPFHSAASGMLTIDIDPQCQCHEAFWNSPSRDCSTAHVIIGEQPEDNYYY